MTTEEIKTRRSGVQIVTILSEYQICELCRNPSAGIAAWLREGNPFAFRPYCELCTRKVVRAMVIGKSKEYA